MKKLSHRTWKTAWSADRDFQDRESLAGRWFQTV